MVFPRLCNLSLFSARWIQPIPFKIHFNYYQMKVYKNLQYFGGWLLPYLQPREDCSTSLCLIDTTEMAQVFKCLFVF